MKINVVTWPRGRHSLMAHMLRICLGKDWSVLLDRRKIAVQAKPADLLEMGLTYLVEHDDFLQSVVLLFEDRVARGAEDSAAAFYQFASEEFGRYDRFRALWQQPDLAKAQINIEAAELRSHPKEWLIWVLERITPGKAPTPAKLTRAIRAMEIWLETRVAPDLTQFRHYDVDLFRRLANLRLRRDVVQHVLQEMQIKGSGAEDVLRLQTLETPHALRLQLASPKPFSVPLGKVPAKKVLGKPLTAAEITLAHEMILGRGASTAETERLLHLGHKAQSLAHVFLHSAEFSMRFGAMQKARSAELVPAIVHLHIPKSAGTSLTSVLASNFPHGTKFALNEREMAAFENLSEPAKKQLRLVFGHLQHGVGAQLPQGCIYVCALREPGDRLLSFYRYMKRRTDHPMYRMLNQSDMSFGEFLEFCGTHPEHRCEADNGQMRRLAGQMHQSAIGHEHQLFKTALNNVFAPNMIFGLTEHFDLLLEDLASRKLITTAKTVVENAAPETANFAEAKSHLTERQFEWLNIFTKWDNELYHICKLSVVGIDTDKDYPK
ncbi:MAG: sulfotransferase family 2 domain-containing protein [Cypionkella sp.]